MEKIGHEQNFNVICAKGRFAYNNAGNKRFRQIVKKYLEHYDNASNKIVKSRVVTAQCRIFPSSLLFRGDHPQISSCKFDIFP